MSNADLLKELRIDRSQREDHGSHDSVRWPWIVGGIVIVLALAAAAGWLWLGHRAVIVETAVAVSPNNDSEAGAVLQATGYVTARRQATVSAQITGTLIDVLIEEGDRVKKDQVLARLDDSGYRAALDSAKAAAGAAHALVAQYRSQLTQNLRDDDRQQSIAAQGRVAKQVAEQAHTLADTARAAGFAAASGHCRRRAGGRGAGQLQLLRGARAFRRRDHHQGCADRRNHLAVFGGRRFHPYRCGTIVDTDSLEVDVDVNEAYIGKVKANMPAEAVLDAYPDWKIPAHVIAIVPTADRGKATIKVRVALEHKDGRIVPDMGVRVSFLEVKPQGATKAPQGVLVPATAIVQRAGHSVVFVFDHDKVRQRVVNPAAQTYGDLRLLPAALASGDMVVISPPPELHDGSDVQIKKSP